MAYILGKIRNIKAEAIKQKLAQDATTHASEGMFLQYIWQNTNDENEVFFIFRVDDLEASKKRIAQRHEETLILNPEANLPEMIYLDSV